MSRQIGQFAPKANNCRNTHFFDIEVLLFTRMDNEANLIYPLGHHINRTYIITVLVKNPEFGTVTLSNILESLKSSGIKQPFKLPHEFLFLFVVNVQPLDPKLN